MLRPPLTLFLSRMKLPSRSAICVLLLAGGLTACTGAQDAAKQAKAINEQRNDLAAANIQTPEQVRDKLNYDSDFAVAASSTGQLDVALAKLAQQKAIAQEVKDWAKQVEADHTKINNTLEDLAPRIGIALPKMMSEDDRDHYDDVDDRKYFGFDKKFLRALSDAQERDIKRYEEGAEQLSSPGLRDFAATTLPLLREHHAKTEELYDRANERK